MPEKNIINLVVGPIRTNCWIYAQGNGSAAVIDPGDDAELIISALKKNSLVPEYILLTHGHYDHILAVPQLSAAFDPKPKIAIHRLDSQYLGADAYSAHAVSAKAVFGNTDFIDAFWNGMPSADILLEEGSEIGVFTVLHTPGHTQGSSVFWDKKAGVLFTGDTLFRNGFGRTDLPGGIESRLFESLNRLLKMDKNTAVCPGHGDTTTIGREAG